MTYSEEQISALCDVTALACDAANAVTLRHFRTSDLATENKDADGFDPVTRADKDAEAAIRAVLAAQRPDDGILGEEHATKPGTSGLTWVLDPIDGTRGFISGTPTWGTLISVGDSDGPLVGVIEQPYIGERFWGTPSGAFLEHAGKRHALSTRAPRALDMATIFTTFPEVGTPAHEKAFHKLAGQTRQTRYGMDCYAYALLAAGQIDLVVEAGLNSYDIHAPVAVIQAAGGVVTNWQGQPVHMGGDVVAASCPQLHQVALDILNS